MQITLYYAPGAASLVVHWVLIELGLPHELRRVDTDARQQKSPEYLALNPNGVIPTMVLDGRPYYECGALLMHLADLFPAAGFAPPPGTPERGRYYQWSFNLANAVQPLLRQWWYPAEVAGEANSPAALATVEKRIEAQWQRIDEHLAAHGPYLLGNQLTTADFMLTMLMRWARKTPRPATEWPQLAALAARMKSRPSFRTLCEREQLTEWT
jgi:glutathione S-transferase